MRSIIPSKLEEGRVREGRMASTSDYGTTGAFFVTGPKGVVLKIIASDGEGWEHVSVSTEHRTPNWAEMCFVKDLFWGEDECVVQFHPPKSEYINCHPYCLHLWKPEGITLPQPPSILVGPSAALDPATPQRSAKRLRAAESGSAVGCAGRSAAKPGRREMNDFAKFLRTADGLRCPTERELEAADRIEALEAALRRCQIVLGNMALENEGAIFNRWPINHEPLRNDARNLLPVIEAARKMIDLNWRHEDAEYYKLHARIEALEAALREIVELTNISKNTCCNTCRRAAVVVRAALDKDA